jgi:hypothetical protein
VYLRRIEKGERLNARQTKRCRKLAERYATQAMTKVWGEGGSAGAQRLQRLFEGRDPWSGDDLCWGDDGYGQSRVPSDARCAGSPAGVDCSACLGAGDAACAACVLLLVIIRRAAR